VSPERDTASHGRAEECRKDSPEPLDFSHEPPVDRYCDLVLTGGVTDGVVYPWAVMELARHYRFRSIGGTSVGALAAALTAAAEYARRYGSLAGFNEVISKLPEKLGESVNGQPRLFTLFQPKKSTRRLFKLFVGFFSPLKNTTEIEPTSWFAAKFVRPVRTSFSEGGLGKYMVAPLSAYRLFALIGLIVGLSIGTAAVAGFMGWCGDSGSLGTWIGRGVGVVGAVTTLILVVLFVVVLVVIGVVSDVVRGLVPNGFGICTGGHVDGAPADEQALVEWLHTGIQLAAGKRLDQPLTFKDLWDAPGGPQGRPMPSALPSRKSRSIDLRMVTTNLTQGRLYGVPLEDDTSRLFFRIEELKPFFPREVIQHLENHSKSAFGLPGYTDHRELPKGALPVVVAARLSLSFPVLFSAVPLWAIERRPDHPERLGKCLFSDGAICSDFPIHLFDAAIPEWPTFGISLESADGPKVWLPEQDPQGLEEVWNPGVSLTDFASSLLDSATNWNDNASARMPGVRDRVVRLFLGKAQSGLDLRLGASRIMQLSREYGLPGAAALVRRFIGHTDTEPAEGWREHRWIRFNTLLVALRERVDALEAAAERARYSTPLSRQILEATRHRPLAGNDPGGGELSNPQAEDLENLLEALEALESGFANAVNRQPYVPKPTPNLRIRPPL
jgi:predicted acylesterase/phospholipase RssA